MSVLPYIAKSIIIIPENPTFIFKVGYVDLFNINNNKLIYSPNFWINNILTKIKPLEINLNIKSQLDPTLLINSFEDLQRYYKNINVYISWEYETEEEKENDPIVLRNYILNSSEDFSNKIQSAVFTKNLKDLIYYNDKKYFIKKDNNYQINIIGGNIDYTGLAMIGAKINNYNNIYNIWEEIIGKENVIMYGKRENVNVPSGGNIPELNINDNTSMYLGFQNLDNSRLNFNLQLFPIYLYLNLQAYNSSQNVSKRTYRETTKIKLTISKIILNAR